MAKLFCFILKSVTPHGVIFENTIIAGTTLASRDKHKKEIVKCISDDSHTFIDYECESVIDEAGIYTGNDGKTYRIESVKDRDAFGYSQKMKWGKMRDDKIVWFHRDGRAFNNKQLRIVK